MSTIAVKKVKLGDNADLSKNFLIEVPAVADGTLTIKREDGTNVLSIDANGKAVIPGVVGTVAQVGGVPTGQVVERGSNANGEYVRFADGTQICTAYKTDLVWSTAANWAGTTTSLHLSTTSPLFPASFVSPQTAVVRLVQINSSQLAACDDSVTQGWSNIRTVNTIGTAAPTAVRLLAIGRWF